MVNRGGGHELLYEGKRSGVRLMVGLSMSNDKIN